MKYVYEEVNTHWLNRPDIVYLYATNEQGESILMAEKHFRNDITGKEEKRAHISLLRGAGYISFEEFLVKTGGTVKTEN